MKEKIVFATGNQGKMREVRLILADLGMEILSMKEAGADVDIVEDGKTFGVKDMNIISTILNTTKNGMKLAVAILLNLKVTVPDIVLIMMFSTGSWKAIN